MRIPGKFVLAALLSSGIISMVSAALIVLCSTALAFRYDCSAGNLTLKSGSHYLLTMIYKLYIQDDQCANSLSFRDLTKSETVFVLTCLTLSFSVTNLAAAMVLTITTLKENAARYIDFVTYTYVGLCTASFMVDLTLAVNFGMDYGTLTSRLNESLAGMSSNYENDTLRIGAMFVMVLAMKGFVAHGVNGVLLVMMLLYLREYQARLLRNEHSIHSRGVLNAYEHSKRGDDIWQMQEDWSAGFGRRHSKRGIDRPSDNIWQMQEDVSAGFGRSVNVNHGFNHDEGLTRSPMSDPHLNRNSDPIDCCHHTQPCSTRPFTYLEEPCRYITPKHGARPCEPVWRRDPMSLPPTLPMPDYSPGPKRLKSALKSAYI